MQILDARHGVHHACPAGAPRVMTCAMRLDQGWRE
jgi:hypothetical protein